ncbi:MAG: ABC transporter permease subunit, partial [Chloroflexota bacterium]
PDNFDLSQLLLQFTIVIIGGLGSLFGSVVGAALISALPELLLNIPGMEEIVFGLLLIIILLFLPRGLAGLAERIAPWLRDRYVQE